MAALENADRLNPQSFAAVHQRLSSANGVEELDVEMAFLYRSIFRRCC